MNTFQFEAAVFGKPRDGSSYAVLARSPAFSKAAEDALLAIAQGFEFQSVGPQDSNHGDCFAIWPVAGDGCLVSRLSDAGSDRFGRRHTLRIEAAHIPTEILALDDRLPYRCLSETAWPSDRLTGESRITLAPCDEPADLCGGVLPNPTSGYPRLIRLQDAMCRVPGFEWTLSSDGVLTRGTTASQKAQRPIVMMHSESRLPMPTPPPKNLPRSSRALVWLLTSLLVPSLAGNAVLWELKNRSERRADERRLESERIQREKESVATELAEVERDRAAAVEKLERQRVAEDRMTAVASHFGFSTAKQLREFLSQHQTGRQPAILTDEQQVDEYVKDVNEAVRALADFVKKPQRPNFWSGRGSQEVEGTRSVSPAQPP